jgi:flagellar motor switch protein FliG
METNKEKGHNFVLDCGAFQVNLKSTSRFIMERWVEALTISMQNSRETKQSATGSLKNIAKIVSNYDWNQN